MSNKFKFIVLNLDLLYSEANGGRMQKFISFEKIQKGFTVQQFKQLQENIIKLFLIL